MKYLARALFKSVSLFLDSLSDLARCDCLCPSCANVSRAPPLGGGSSLRVARASSRGRDRSPCGARGASRLAPRSSANARLSPQIVARVKTGNPKEPVCGQGFRARGLPQKRVRHACQSAQPMNHQMNQNWWKSVENGGVWWSLVEQLAQCASPCPRAAPALIMPGSTGGN